MLFRSAVNPDHIAYIWTRTLLAGEMAIDRLFDAGGIDPRVYGDDFPGEFAAAVAGLRGAGHNENAAAQAMASAGLARTYRGTFYPLHPPPLADAVRDRLATLTSAQQELYVLIAELGVVNHRDLERLYALLHQSAPREEDLTRLADEGWIHRNEYNDGNVSYIGGGRPEDIGIDDWLTLALHRNGLFPSALLRRLRGEAGIRIR